MNVHPNQFNELFDKYQHITVIGLSPKPEKPSHQIPLFMHSKGYKVVGVYPGVEKIGPFDIFESLKDVPPVYRKFVNVFRRSEDIPAVVDQILAVGGVEVLWLQLGIANQEAESRAERAGIKVVSNRCWLVDYNNTQP